MKDFDIYITEAQQFALAAERYGKQKDAKYQKKFAVKAAEHYLLAGTNAKSPQDKDFALDRRGVLSLLRRGRLY